MKKLIPFILALSMSGCFTKVYAEDKITIEKVDDLTVKITTVKDPEIVIIDIKELKNRVIDAQSRLDYAKVQHLEDEVVKQKELDEAIFKVTEAQKAGVDSADDATTPVAP